MKNNLLTNYFDTASATPIDERVLASMLPYMQTYFANPNAQHLAGKHTAEAIHTATQKVADLLNIDPKGIVWTSGASESITTSVFSATQYYATAQRNKVLTTAIEHSALSESILNQPNSVGYLSSVKNGGLIVPDEILNFKDVYMLATHHINNEIGVIQPMEKILDICDQHGIISCIDATQSIGKVPLTSLPVNADYLTLACHKAFGPRGVGLLYVKQKPKRHIKPIIYGQSRWHQRPGTPNTALIVGFAKALEIFDIDSIKQVETLKNYFFKHCHPDIKPNIKHNCKVPHILNIHLEHVLAPTLMHYLSDYCLATGSACHSENYSPSDILKVIFENDAIPRESLRISLCHWHTKEDILNLCKKLNDVYLKLKAINP